MIFLRGKDGIEIPEDPESRGFARRVKNAIPGGRTEYHVAELLPGFQQPHVHKGQDHETVVLLTGKILAIAWKENRGEFYLLEEEGDSITLLPNEYHTLIVLAKSKVVTWGQWMPSAKGNRKAIPLPLSINTMIEALKTPLTQRVVEELKSR